VHAANREEQKRGWESKNGIALPDQVRAVVVVDHRGGVECLCALLALCRTAEKPRREAVVARRAAPCRLSPRGALAGRSSNVIRFMQLACSG
jgi:hypothetical protein